MLTCPVCGKVLSMFDLVEDDNGKYNYKCSKCETNLRIVPKAPKFINIRIYQYIEMDSDRWK